MSLQTTAALLLVGIEVAVALHGMVSVAVCPLAAASGLGKFKGFETLRNRCRQPPSPPQQPHQSRHT